MPLNIAIFGDSHTQAFKQALEKKLFCSRQVDVSVSAHRYARMKNGQKIGDLEDDQIHQMVARFHAQDLVVSTIGGNQHQLFALIQHPIPFDVFPFNHERWKFSLDLTCIPRAQIFDTLEKGIRGKDFYRIKHLKNVSNCRVVHLVPPPPKKDSDHILRRHESDFVKRGLSEKGVSPASLRMNVWKIQVEVLGLLAREIGITLLDPPAATVDAEGFLAPAFYANDATHANSDYAALALRDLETFAATP